MVRLLLLLPSIIYLCLIKMDLGFADVQGSSGRIV